MIETTPGASASSDSGSTGSAGSRRGSEPRQAQRGRRWRLWIMSAVILTLALVVVAVSIFAPDTPAPDSFFNTTPVAPLGRLRTPNAHATPLAAMLREQAETQYVNGLISHMTLDEEIGQMIMIGFSETQMDDALAYQIQQLHVGSAILYAFNIQNGPQMQALVSGMQADATTPLLIATDQEGGEVNRLASVIGLTPSAAMIGATGNTNLAHQRGLQDAQALAQLGINLDLAPVVDVLQTSGGDVQSRSFGSTPGKVTVMAGAYLSGLEQSGQVAGALKHFPGLGDVPVDPHEQLYTLNRSKAQLEAIDWAPYRALLATGEVHAIMSTHVILGAIDPTRPASLSEPVLTGILRDELGFNGVIITDGIYMHALQSYSLDQIALYAVQAGNDIICSTYSIQSTEEVIATLHNAVQSGKLSKAHIDASVRRILLLKLQLGLLHAPNFGLSGLGVK
ncbi:MAG TPA: glycoside hydrolase family 3 N-terminal domain-containing protein [Ktedonobacterales bacterium]|nr:glycoside hydrolase family 3 N-terminal domain-containing protein [Ktedonobacterales bacterium]